jgi:sulfofructose kinase
VTAPRVVCIGVITMDTVARVERYPAADDRVLAEDLVRSTGGPAAVAAITLSRLGIPTAIVGTVGDDADGRETLEILAAAGVDTSGVQVSSEVRTAASVIIASGASRAIATRQRPVQADPSATARALVAAAEWVHVDQVGVTMLDAFGIRRGEGPRISFDAGYDVAAFDASTVDLFAPTDRQIAARHPHRSFDEGMREDAAQSGAIVVATRGADGSAVVTDDGEVLTVPGFRVPVVSTLGAGDVFHGALLAQVIEGRPWADALRRANAVAALKCRSLDGHSGIPTVHELETFLSQQGATT